MWPTQGSETSKYLEEKKEKSIPSVAGERNRKSPNHEGFPLWGCRVFHMGVTKLWLAEVVPGYGTP